MTITTATEKVMENVKEMKEHFLHEAIKSDAFIDMESREMELVWRMFKSLDHSMAAMMTQATIIDDLTNKIDILLEASKKEEA